MSRFLLCCLFLSEAFSQTPDALRKHVSYLASDELKGRSIPSAGLDSAAAYIAGQFQKIGLEPIGDNRYFQIYDRVLMRPDWSGYEFTIRGGKKAIKVLPTEVLPFSTVALTFDHAELIKVDPENGPWLLGLHRQDIEGKILAIRIVAQDEGEEKQDNFQSAMSLVSKFSCSLPPPQQLRLATRGNQERDEYAVAFLNSEGGRIFWGIRDSEDFNDSGTGSIRR